MITDQIRKIKKILENEGLENRVLMKKRENRNRSRGFKFYN